MAGAIGGVALRTLGTVIRIIQFCASIIILAFFSYFLATLNKQNLDIQQWVRAVEGLSGAGALYTLFGLLLTFFLGGVSIFAFIAIILDILFIGAFMAIAIETRGGDTNCDYLPNEDSLRFGPNGLGDSVTTYHACTFMKACFILAIINTLLFLISAPIQFAIWQHHKREKAAGISSTSGGWLHRKRASRVQPNTPVVAKRRGLFGRKKAAAYDTETGTVPTNGTYATNGAYGIDNNNHHKIGH